MKGLQFVLKGNDRAELTPHPPSPQALVICPNASVAALYRLLYRALGFPAIQSHARLPQEARIAALDLFRMQPTAPPEGARRGAGGSAPPPSGGILLFATDLVLMGAELPAVDLVVQVGGSAEGAPGRVL